MIVILEGSDLTGNSTLAASLTATRDGQITQIHWDRLGDPEIETLAVADTTPEQVTAQVETFLNTVRP